MLAAVVVAASAGLVLTSAGDPAYLAPELAIVGTLAAFVMALCFRQLSSISKEAGNAVDTRRHDRTLLTAALVIAAATLFADARIVAGVAPHIFTRTLRQLTGSAPGR